MPDHEELLRRIQARFFSLDRRALVAAGIALLMLGVAAIEFDRPRPTPAGAVNAWLPAPERSRTSRPPAESSMMKPRDSADQGGSAKNASDVDKLLALFGGLKDNPAAQQFAEEFKKEPVLAKDWEDYQEDQQSPEPKETAEAFAEKVSARPEFRGLAAKFAQDPGFKQALLTLSENPRMKGIIASAVSRLESEKKQRASKTALTALRGGGRGPGAATSGGVSNAFDAQSPAPRHSESGKTEAPGGQFSAAGPNSAAAAGPEAHEAQKLEDIKSTSPKNDDRTWASFCAQSSSEWKAICKKLEPFLGQYSECGACYAAGVYDQCTEICKSGQVSCKTPWCSFVEACTDTKSETPDEATKLACRAECEKRGRTDCGEGPDDPADAGAKQACQEKSEKDAKRSCYWIGSYKKCWCYDDTPESGNIRTEKTACASENKKAGGKNCVWNDSLRRCACFASDTWTEFTTQCEKLGKNCKFSKVWTRCSCPGLQNLLKGLPKSDVNSLSDY